MYPRVIFHSEIYQKNLRIMRERFDKLGLSLLAVTKVYGADPHITQYADGIVDFFGDSRIGNIKKMQGLKKPKVLIRIPMLCELEEVLDYVDISFHSEIAVMQKLNQIAQQKSITHKIVLMRDFRRFTGRLFG